MNDALHKLGGGDIGVVVVLALYALLSQSDCLLRAVLQAAEALDAVRAEARLSVYKSDVALRAELFALAAAYACVGDGEFLRLTGAILTALKSPRARTPSRSASTPATSAAACTR